MLSSGGAEREIYFPGDGIDAIEDFEVPAKGDWLASVYLRDAAGNESPANRAAAPTCGLTTRSRAFAASQVANGLDQPRRARRRLPAGMESRARRAIPPSGDRRLSRDRQSKQRHRPMLRRRRSACMRRTRSPRPADRQRRASPRRGDLAEGTNYVHVAPFGLGDARDRRSATRPLKVDLSDPSTVLNGDGDGEWMSHDASLEPVASDSDLGDGRYRRVPVRRAAASRAHGRRADVCGHRPSVSADITTEGAHQVTWCARDLAGNGTCDFSGGAARATGSSASGQATVRIDKTAPARRLHERPGSRRPRSARRRP